MPFSPFRIADLDVRPHAVVANGSIAATSG